MSDIQEEIEYEQHCNEQLRNKITNLEYKIERLKEENIKLKELCNKYEEEHKTTFIEWQKDIKVNKKAIEYIDKYLEREYFDTDILETNTIYNRDLFKVKQILDKESE